MRAARLLLIVCLLLGLAAVFFAARASLVELRASAFEQCRRTLSAELVPEAARVGKLVTQRLESIPPDAVYHADGSLKWPHPPWEARVFRAPDRSPSSILLALGDLEAALEEATSSHERAAVLLAMGVRKRDAALLDQALAEEALEGTDVALRLELERFRIRDVAPDAGWIDRVSALWGGPSERFAVSLLADAGLKPTFSRKWRRNLGSNRAQAGLIAVYTDTISCYEATEGGEIVLRSIPVDDLGGLTIRHQPDQAWAALPAPNDRFELVRDVSDAVLERQMSRQRVPVLLLYGGAALVLLIGTAYALVAMGRAERLARAKSDFVANVTHELKTPLANIRLYAESLREGRVRDEDRDEFVGTILEESGRLDALIEGLLHAARGARLEMGPVDGARLLREAEERWRARLEREGFDLAVTTPETLPLRGDEEALRRALDNLIDNARKYGSDDRRIELTAGARDGEARLTVRDHGPGIPVGERGRVLQPFHRLEAADRKETAGTGLGLSLVVATMEAHGGRVEISGGAGEGACVSLVLPVENKA